MLLLPKIQDKLDEREIIKLKNKNENLSADLKNQRDENIALREDTRVFREEIFKQKKKIEELENEIQQNTT